MKPTPMQGRLLCLLAAHPAYVLLHRGRASVEADRRNWGEWKDPGYERARDGFSHAHLAANLQGLRRASVEACIRAGWLTEEQHGPYEWNRGWFITDGGRDIAAMLGPEDLKDKPKSSPALVDMELIYDALRGKWPTDDGWVWFREFSPGVNGRRLDALVINRWSGKHRHERMAFEIKRTRGDFLGELKKPEKRLEGGSIADRLWFVTPAELVDADEVPGDCGLLWIDEDGKVSVKRKAPRRSEQAPTGRRLLGAILTYIVDRPDQREWRKAMKDL